MLLKGLEKNTLFPFILTQMVISSRFFSAFYSYTCIYGQPTSQTLSICANHFYQKDSHEKENICLRKEPKADISSAW